MGYFILKTFISALVIAGVSELARRYSLFAALIASLPLTSILAFIWLWRDTHDISKVSALSSDILWLVIPSLLFFLLFPVCTRMGMGFWQALAASTFGMLAAYGLFIAARQLFLK